MQQLHREYAGGRERLLQGYREIEEGLASGDYSHLTRGREVMLAWRGAIGRVAAELATLTDQAGVSAPGVGGRGLGEPVAAPPVR